MSWLRKRRRDPEIAPDEIFLDASNSPEFNRARFEGRLEQPLPGSTFFSIAVILSLMLCVLIVRAAHLELINGAAFAAESARNSLEATTLFAPRGVITDRNGVILAHNIAMPDGSVKREYPVPELGQIIGYVSYPKKDSNGNYYDTSETGLAGIEAEYDSLLSGVNGQLLVEKDALGQVRSEGAVVPAKEGKPLQLSIDADLERNFARAIKTIAQDKHFIAGAGVIMDVETGAVRAIVSYPSYDPNVLSGGGSAGDLNAYNADPGHPFLDHAVQGVYTPGSIVKPFVAAGALTDHLITPDTVIDDPGKLLVSDPYHPGKSFVYNGWRALGPVDVRKAIAWSSDVFFYTVGGGFGPQKGLGIDRLEYWYRQFGLGSPTGVALPREASGVIPDPAWKERTFGEPWYLGDTYFTAIGQYSVQVTPMQMARATAVVANGGKLLVPTMLADQPPVSTTVPVDPAMLAVVREGMRQSVTSALASAINLPYIAAAAKTGTAQVGAHNEFDNSWAEGFFPYESPRYAFAVVLERGPSGTGEQSVNVMQSLFEALHAEGSSYVGGLPVPPAASTTMSRTPVQ